MSDGNGTERFAADVDNTDYSSLIEPIKRRMTSAVWRIVRDPHETEDVVGEVLMRLVRDMDRVREHRNPTAFMLRMCTSAAIDHVRKRNRRGRLLERWWKERPATADAPASGPAERREIREAVLGAVARLPRREGEAILLHAVEGFTYAETAEAMGCRESTVRVLVTRARKRLRESAALARALQGVEHTDDA
ncbi:MAG: RNA polymerase sigma factor [bacterium]|nr:RNA polymerase sigma factor [bacterium]